MSANPFYSYSGSIIQGTLGRAESVAAEFASVQAGFALLATAGVDTGAANAYVVTTGGQPTGAYVDGNTVEFKPLVTNTGASTVNVNSVGVANILRFNGAALIAGDLSANVWTTITYNASFSAFTLVGPGQTAVIAGSISSAAPTHKVGLVAAGGSSIQAAPIDVTFAIDQSIAPTWTGLHTFNDGIVVSGGTNNFAVNSSGDVVISASSGTALTITGAGGVGSKVFQFNAGGSSVYGLMDTTNVAGAYIGLSISGTLDGIIGMGAVAITGAALADLCLTPNTGVLRLGYNNGAATALSINNTGNVVVAAPTAGVGLTVNSVSGSSGLVVNQSGGATAALTVAATGVVTIAAPTAGVGLTVNSVSGSSGLVVNQSGGSTAALTVAATGVVTIAAPSSGTALTVSGLATGGSALSVSAGAAGAIADFITGTHHGQIFIGGSGVQFGSVSNEAVGFFVNNGSPSLTIAAAGNVTIAAPNSGVALTINGTSAQVGVFNGSASNTYCDYNRSATLIGRIGSADSVVSSGATTDFGISAPGGGLNIATGASSTSRLTIGSSGGMVLDSATGGNEGAGTINVASGYYINGTNVLTIVQNSQAQPYTCVLADLGKSVYCTTNGGTVTIPANSSVAYPLGAAITFVAASGVTLTIAITTDTLTLAGTSTTGSRTLAANGVATALKVTSTSWIIGGSGLT